MWTIPFAPGLLAGMTCRVYGDDARTEGADVEDQMAAFQDEGYALLVYVGGTRAAWCSFLDGGKDDIEGRVELVRYSKGADSATGLRFTRLTDADGIETAPAREQDYEILVGWSQGLGGAPMQPRPAPVYVVPVSVRSSRASRDAYLDPTEEEQLTQWVAQLRAPEEDLWEWFRYNEIHDDGIGSFFLQTGPREPRLLIDTVDYPDWDRDIVDRLATPLLGRAPARAPAWMQRRPEDRPSVERVAALLRFRGVQDDRDGDGRVDDWPRRDRRTTPRYPPGTPVMPVAAAYGGPDPAGSRAGEDFAIWPRPGRFDRVGLVTGDDAQRTGGDLTVQWSMDSTDRRLFDVTGIDGQGEISVIDLDAFAHLFALSGAVEEAFEPDADVDLRAADLRGVARLIAFPSGEMPDNLPDLCEARIGVRFSGDVSPAVIDEVCGGRRAVGTAHALIDALDDGPASVLSVVTPHGAPDPGARPPEPGLLKVGRELIAYKTVEPVGPTWLFAGCVRGVMGTEPGVHERGARVEPLFGVHLGLLSGALGETERAIRGPGLERFPRTGVVRLEDVEAGVVELRLYTANTEEGLTMPADAGGAGVFVGRYGTRAHAFVAGTPVFWQPVRVWDRYAEACDDPELGYWSISTDVTDAFVKRVTWEEDLGAPCVNVRAVLRVDGAAPWDAGPRRTLLQGAEHERSRAGRLPDLDFLRDLREHPRAFLYAMDDAQGDNLIGLQARTVEVRLYVTFEEGAYDWLDPGVRGWKTAPRVEMVALEYVQPDRVWRHADE